METKLLDIRSAFKYDTCIR